MKTQVQVNKLTGTVLATATIADRVITKKITSKTVGDFVSAVRETLGEFSLDMMESTLERMKRDLTELCHGVELGGGTVIATAGGIRSYSDMNLAVNLIADELVERGMPEISDDVKTRIKNSITAGHLVREMVGASKFTDKSSCGEEIQLFPPPKESFLDKLLKGGLPPQVAEKVSAADGKARKVMGLDVLDARDLGLDARDLGLATLKLKEKLARKKIISEAFTTREAIRESKSKHSIFHRGKEVKSFDLDFGTALTALRAGEAIACDHWPKGVFLTIAGTEGGSDYIVMHTSNKKVMPWAPTHESLLSDNWVVLA